MKLNYIFIPGIAIIVAYLGKYFTAQGMNWYDTVLITPSYLPHKCVFPIVWTVIYFLTTIVALYVWNYLQDKKQFRFMIFLLVANAGLNVLWTYLFFYRHMIGLAFIDALLLFLVTTALALLLWRHKKSVALLLAPYIVWIFFACILNFHIWLIN